MTTSRIYLDHAATTPMDPEIVKVMLPFFTENGHNPSSLHEEGRRARAALDGARDRVAAVLGVSRKEIVFTGGGSEADNLAIIGVARRLRERGRHIVSSAIEHHAVLHALDMLRDDGFEITLLPVGERGVVDTGAFARALRDDTILASVMYANNELGTIQPLYELAAIAHEHNVLIHTDAVQAGYWLPIQPRELGVDLLSLSAHKFYGPKGVGVLYVREGTPIEPIVHGGGQEFGRRSGTENVAGIVGLSYALERSAQGREERNARVGALRDRLEAGILEAVPDARVNGGGARLPNITNISFGGLDSEELLMGLDLGGVAVSAGSACTSGALEPSHVIAALGLDPYWQQGVIRFSLGQKSTEGEIDHTIRLLARLASERRGNTTSARKARLS